MDLRVALLAAVGGIIEPHLAHGVVDGLVMVNGSTGRDQRFEPVAYFTRHATLCAKPDLELRLSGATRLFENAGNRDAFAERSEVYSEVYMLHFAGYDPVAIARGASVPGNPLFSAIVGERRYFFYKYKARTLFFADPGRIIAFAARKWPAVANTIGQ